VLTSGCVGRDVTRPSAEFLRLGKTTYAEVIARFGSPDYEGMTDQTVKAVVYSYARHGEESRVDQMARARVPGLTKLLGVTPARAQRYYFVDSLLVGHEYLSSFATDHTDFNETRIAQIKKGTTTQVEVTDLMGPSTGSYMYPLVSRKNDRGLVYAYYQTQTEQLSAPKYR